MSHHHGCFLPEIAGMADSVLTEAGRDELLPYAIRMREVFDKSENRLTRRVTHLHCSLPRDLDVLFGTLKQRYTVRNVYNRT
jgi:hypothetical protein